MFLFEKKKKLNRNNLWEEVKKERDRRGGTKHEGREKRDNGRMGLT